MNNAIIITFAAVLLLAQYDFAKADTGVKVDEAQVKAVVELTTALLHKNGWLADDTKKIPAVYITDLYSADAVTSGKVIVLNARRPVACFEAYIAHEMVHIIMARDWGIAPKGSEYQARLIDKEVAGDNVNCATKGH